MYCPQCGTQTEQKAKFCKSCGLKLAGHARLLEEPREAERMTQEQWRREKRMMAGVTLMMVTAFDLIIFLIVFGSVTLSHLDGKVFRASLIVLLTFLFVSLALGAVGAFNLISSGFFKNIRERQLRAELAMLEQKRKALEEMNSPINQAIPQSPRMKPEPEMIRRHRTHDAGASVIGHPRFYWSLYMSRCDAMKKMKISSTKPHEETLRIDFIFVILRVALWIDCLRRFYVRNHRICG